MRIQPAQILCRTFLVLSILATFQLSHAQSGYQISFQVNGTAQSVAIDTVGFSIFRCVAAQYLPPNGDPKVLVTQVDSFTLPFWTMTFGSAGNSYWPHDILAEPIGAYIVAGEVDIDNNGDRDAFLLQLGTNGAVQWRSLYGESVFDEGFHATSGYANAMYGSTGYKDVQGFFGPHRDLYFHLASNNTGSEQVSATIGGPLPEEGLDIVNTGKGEFICAGYSQSFSTQADPDIYLVKFDSLGQKVWSRVISCGDQADVAHAITKVNSNLYAVTGVTSSYSNAMAGEVFLLEIDSNGTVLNLEVYGNSEGRTGRDIKATNDGGYIISGGTDLGSEAFFLKLDSSRSQEWHWQYEGELINELVYENGEITGVGTYTDPSSGLEMYQIRVLPNGSTQCGDTAINLNQITPAFQTIVPNDMHALAAGSVFATDIPGTVNLSFGPVCTATDLEDQSQFALIAFPNPSQESVKISIGPDKVGEVPFELFDLQGRKWIEGILSEGEAQIDVSGLAKGLYFLKVQIEGQLINKKLMVQ